MTLGEFRALTAGLPGSTPFLVPQGWPYGAYRPANVMRKEVGGEGNHFYSPHPWDEEKMEMREAILVY